jgi:hypothetical protein
MPFLKLGTRVEYESLMVHSNLDRFLNRSSDERGYPGSADGTGSERAVPRTPDAGSYSTSF